MRDADLLKLHISELAPKIRAREISPVEVVDAALSQADRLQPTLNSFITIFHEEARKQAREQEEALARGAYRGPLQGVPIGLKDNIQVAGTRTTLGSKVWTDRVAKEDSYVVTLCREAGAVFLGKENMHEFAAGPTSNNPHFGAVRNPWAPGHIPGGSSGGGGANVAACITYASLGTDGGGSVRLPGAFCGVVGLKQTYGRVSLRGILMSSYSGDYVSPITRSVRDNATVLQAIVGYDPLDPGMVPVPVPDYSAELEIGLRGLKMGIPTDHYFDYLDPEVEASVSSAIANLEKLGVEPRRVALPSMKYAGALHYAFVADNVAIHEPYIEAHHQEYGPDILRRTLAGQFVLGREYAKCLKLQRIMKEEHARALQEVDFLVMPTSPSPAPEIEVTTPVPGKVGSHAPKSATGMLTRNTRATNGTGLPAISVPCGFTLRGLPIGLQIIARAFEEVLMFRVAHNYEAVSPSRGRNPALADGPAIN